MKEKLTVELTRSEAEFILSQLKHYDSTGSWAIQSKLRQAIVEGIEPGYNPDALVPGDKYSRVLVDETGRTFWGGLVYGGRLDGGHVFDHAGLIKLSDDEVREQILEEAEGQIFQRHRPFGEELRQSFRGEGS